MKEISSSGKQKKLNRGGRNVNSRYDHTVDYSSYWGNAICSRIQNIKKHNL